MLDARFPVEVVGGVPVVIAPEEIRHHERWRAAVRPAPRGRGRAPHARGRHDPDPVLRFVRGRLRYPDRRGTSEPKPKAVRCCWSFPAPPSSGFSLHVAGKNADDIGNQCGGWTIDWQGKSGDVTPGGTTMLAAIRKAAPGAKVTFSKDGTGAEGATVGVVVIGETPYAEMQGDRADLRLAQEDVNAVDRMKAAGIPVVVILFSGRPMIVDSILAKADALVAAWLPGTEGQGITDVLFGDYKPVGKLSRSWPRSMEQIPLHPGDEPLFQFGYGLSY